MYGYKAFNKGLTDNYGNIYELNKNYFYDGNIKFKQSGFHFCENLEDVLRYYNSFERDIEICLIKAFGNIVTYNDEYYGYYNMHSSSNFMILKVLSRKEIIDIMLNTNEVRICRFIMGFKLTEDEIDIILNKFNSKMIIDYISYYQKNDKDVFKRARR